ncbi:XdhC family protein [Robiginitalea sp. SC105]|uniref:XdhC family protein n=1 Tax=Robiginitalea sp. SC105 TaxID=2762332 RepID=UPI00163B5D7E|nr:XdhC family protein [Robiginitalea sp. SC105]
MTHEVIHIVEAYRKAREIGQQSVLATVVDLDGSSYRRPGVRMLLLENGAAFGAVSGGCVEKEVHRQAREVFETGIPRMMTYDGRFRLGCEGTLYILLEPFEPGDSFLDAFQERIANRLPLELTTTYRREDGAREGLMTQLITPGGNHPAGKGKKAHGNLEFRQVLPPRLRLELFGGEHDTVQLSGLAAQAGWEVCVTVAADESKNRDYFPGASDFRSVIPEQWEAPEMDRQTAVVLMTHSYTKDLKYLLRLSGARPGYLGILGPASRRERLLSDLLDRMPEPDDEFFGQIHGPAGIDIGAETPQEIALSILAEILAVARQKDAIPLRDKEGRIHS